MDISTSTQPFFYLKKTGARSRIFQESGTGPLHQVKWGDFVIRTVLLAILLTFTFLSNAFATVQEKAAFIRHDDLWIKINNKEGRLTKGEYVRYPKWSYDGQWLAYLKAVKQDGNIVYDGELWLCNLHTNKHFKMASKVNRNFQWSGRNNKLAYLINRTLYVVDTKPSKSLVASTLAQGVENFSWLPNGDGLLISAKKSEQLHSDINLSRVMLEVDRQRPILKNLFTIPVGEDEYFVSTSSFKWSSDKGWISFLLIPTASMSADANTLCLLSADGTVFKKVDEMLNYAEWMQWAPAGGPLAYIGGIGREATYNKQTRLIKTPVYQKEVLTPKGYADRDFDWKSDRVTVVSRSVESKEGRLDERPLPQLYEVNLYSGKQKQISLPPKNTGDFVPTFEKGRLIWIRTDRKTADAFVSRTGKIKETKWIKNITLPSSYYEKWNWGEVFSLYTWF
ncbi:translocation protein TolB [Bacillus sp. FJAT-29953]|nr:translocation protein TolB [Bacillus sp. FJAT-29953]